MKLTRCVAFLNVLSLVTGPKNKNLVKDETEVFRRVNGRLSTHSRPTHTAGAESAGAFWDSADPSFAKINLTLHLDPASNVLDDYLGLASLMQKVAWGNRVFIKRISPQESREIEGFFDRTEDGDYLLLVDDTPPAGEKRGDSCASFPFDRTNVISRVLNALGPGRDNYIVLTRKAVPLQAGLGGGSADAAVVANRLLGAGANLSRIGSDVPFLASECDTATVFGIGDKMYEMFTKLHPGWVYLLIPFEKVSTAAAFTRARELITQGKFAAVDMPALVRTTVRDAELSGAFRPHNDLEACVDNAGVKRLRRALKHRFRATRFGMSGSGSAFFVLAKEDADVLRVRETFRDPLAIVKTRFKLGTQSHEFEYL